MANKGRIGLARRNSPSGKRPRPAGDVAGVSVHPTPDNPRPVVVEIEGRRCRYEPAWTVLDNQPSGDLSSSRSPRRRTHHAAGLEVNLNRIAAVVASVASPELGSLDWRTTWIRRRRRALRAPPHRVRMVGFLPATRRTRPLPPRREQSRRQTPPWQAEATRSALSGGGKAGTSPPSNQDPQPVPRFSGSLAWTDPR